MKVPRHLVDPRWPKYNNCDEPVMPGDRAEGTTFDYNGVDSQHVGEVVDVNIKWTSQGWDSYATVEDDEGDGWECDANEMLKLGGAE